MSDLNTFFDFYRVNFSGYTKNGFVLHKTEIKKTTNLKINIHIYVYMFMYYVYMYNCICLQRINIMVFDLV